MIDQATILRGLVDRLPTSEGDRRSTNASQPNPYVFPRGERIPFARTLAVISGKGGVGKSNLALNLALTIAEQDCRVCLLDASPGTGTLELLCGRRSEWGISDVLQGTHPLQKVIQKGPGRIHFFSGAQRLFQRNFTPPPELRKALCELEHEYQMIIIDAGTGLSPEQSEWFSHLDQFLLVSTPEPTSIAESYAIVKSLKGLSVRGRVELLLNQTQTVQQAQKVAAGFRQTAKQFLKTDVDFVGAIPHDPTLSLAVFQRQPLCLAFPTSPAARAVSQLAMKLFQTRPLTTPSSTPFFASLWPKTDPRQIA